jgi:hypothetical protein
VVLPQSPAPSSPAPTREESCAPPAVCVKQNACPPCAPPPVGPQPYAQPQPYAYPAQPPAWQGYAFVSSAPGEAPQPLMLPEVSSAPHPEFWGYPFAQEGPVGETEPVQYDYGSAPVPDWYTNQGLMT